jgi:hypothetical protein
VAEPLRRELRLIRDELLSVELFWCLTEAQVLIEDWRQDYNTRRPHSALGMMAPVRFAAAILQPQLASRPTAAEEAASSAATALPSP